MINNLHKGDKEMTCEHPPTRQYSGFSYVPGADMGVKRPLVEIMWIGCHDCGRIVNKISPFARVKKSELIT